MTSSLAAGYVMSVIDRRLDRAPQPLPACTSDPSDDVIRLHCQSPCVSALPPVNHLLSPPAFTVIHPMPCPLLVSSCPSPACQSPRVPPLSSCPCPSPLSVTPCPAHLPFSAVNHSEADPCPLPVSSCLTPACQSLSSSPIIGSGVDGDRVRSWGVLGAGLSPPGC